VSSFTLDEARQIVLAATGPRKKLPFATDEELLAVLLEAEAAHDDVVWNFEIMTEDSRQRQLLLDFAPAVRKVYSLWRELAIPGRQTILSYCDEACQEDEELRLHLEGGDKDGPEKELLLEFLPAYAEASLEPRIRRARDAARAASTEESADYSKDGSLDGLEDIIETRMRLIRPFPMRDKRWRLYDIALKRLQHGAVEAVEDLEKRGRHRPKELAGLEAFTRVIAAAWAAKPKTPTVAEFSSKFDHVAGSNAQSEYLPKSPAAKFIWEASKHLQPPSSGDLRHIADGRFEERRYTVQNCETVMDYVKGDRRGGKLASNS